MHSRIQSELEILASISSKYFEFLKTMSIKEDSDPPSRAERSEIVSQYSTEVCDDLESKFASLLQNQNDGDEVDQEHSHDSHEFLASKRNEHHVKTGETSSEVSSEIINRSKLQTRLMFLEKNYLVNNSGSNTNASATDNNNAASLRLNPQNNSTEHASRIVTGTQNQSPEDNETAMEDDEEIPEELEEADDSDDVNVPRIEDLESDGSARAIPDRRNIFPAELNTQSNSESSTDFVDIFNSISSTDALAEPIDPETEESEGNEEPDRNLEETQTHSSAPQMSITGQNQDSSVSSGTSAQDEYIEPTPQDIRSSVVSIGSAIMFRRISLVPPPNTNGVRIENRHLISSASLLRQERPVNSATSRLVGPLAEIGSAITVATQPMEIPHGESTISLTNGSEPHTIR